MLDAAGSKKLIAGLLTKAKEVRSAFKYSEDERMAPCVIIAAKGGISFVTMQWRNNAEKYSAMLRVSEVAKELDAEAVALISDTRWVKSEDFCRYFNVPLPTKDGMEKFVAEYQRILREHGGEIKKLPRAVWSEAVCVLVKGPGVGPYSIMADYVEGPGDTVQYLPDDHESTEIVEAEIIPAWWS
jgi:hypothetical protein